MKILKPTEYYVEKVKKYNIPAMKVIARMNYLEAEGFTIEEASKIIAQEVREVAS